MCGIRPSRRGLGPKKRASKARLAEGTEAQGGASSAAAPPPSRNTLAHGSPGPRIDHQRVYRRRKPSHGTASWEERSRRCEQDATRRSAGPGARWVDEQSESPGKKRSSVARARKASAAERQPRRLVGGAGAAFGGGHGAVGKRWQARASAQVSCASVIEASAVQLQCVWRARACGVGGAIEARANSRAVRALLSSPAPPSFLRPVHRPCRLQRTVHVGQSSTQTLVDRSSHSHQPPQPRARLATLVGPAPSLASAHSPFRPPRSLLPPSSLPLTSPPRPRPP